MTSWGKERKKDRKNSTEGYDRRMESAIFKESRREGVERVGDLLKGEKRNLFFGGSTKGTSSLEKEKAGKVTEGTTTLGEREEGNR